MSKDSKDGKSKVKPGSKRKRGRPKGKTDSYSVTIAKKEKKIIELAAQGLSTTDIAKVVNCTRGTVNRRLDKFKNWFKSLEDLDGYSDARGALLDAAEFEMLRSMMKQDKIDKASLNNVAYAFQQVYNARRLESGQATSIQQNQSLNYTKLDITNHKTDSDKDE